MSPYTLSVAQCQRDTNTSFLHGAPSQRIPEVGSSVPHPPDLRCGILDSFLARIAEQCVPPRVDPGVGEDGDGREDQAEPNEKQLQPV